MTKSVCPTATRGVERSPERDRQWPRSFTQSDEADHCHDGVGRALKAFSSG